MSVRVVIAAALRWQVFVGVGMAIFIASAKMAIEPSGSTKLSNSQMEHMQDVIKHQIKRSMKKSMKLQTKLQKKDVKSRDSDTSRMHSLEKEVALAPLLAPVPT